MSIEEQPAPVGLRTLIRGQVRNSGEIPLNIQDVQIIVKIRIAGKQGTQEISAVLDPYPANINPGADHKFFAVVPQGTDPNYTISVNIIKRSQ
jgi:hypothetical protein